MKIGIVGAGHIGANLARLFVKAGNEVAISNSRGPKTLRDLVSELGDRAHAMTVEEAAAFGQVIVISIPFGKYQQLPRKAFQNKIVIDSNNYYPERDGTFAEIEQEKMGSSELLAAHLQGARIVKGFNTIWFEHLKTQGNAKLPAADRRAIFIAGDDSEAKRVVAKLIGEIGFSAVDTGSLRDGGKAQQPGTAIYNKDITAREAKAILKS